MVFACALPLALILAVAAPETPLDDAGRLARSSNAFGLDLYQKIRASPGNLVFSPASVTTALAMTWGGAKGETASQMKQVLHFEGSPAQVTQAAVSLLAPLQDPTQPIVLRVANRLFGEKTFRFEAPFLEATRAAYGAVLEPLGFKEAPEAARVFINGWVEEKTEKRIKDLVPSGEVDATTRLVLVNAIYFLGDWAAPFTKESTSPAPFFTSSTEKRDVATMNRVGHVRFAQRDGWKAIELPYRGNRLAMLVLLPDRGDGIGAVEESLTSAGIEAIAKSLAVARVTVALPKFEVNPAKSLPLGAVLKGMGMRAAFDLALADFTGIANPPDPRDRLLISNVFHKAFVKVDEKGTEAAAATAVVMRAASSAIPQEKPLEFKADHPFLFFIRDTTTGLVLFLGRVSDPSGR